MRPCNPLPNPDEGDASATNSSLLSRRFTGGTPVLVPVNRDRGRDNY